MPKTKDIRNTYRAAERIQQAGKKFLEFQKERRDKEDNYFSQMMEIGGKLLTLARVELFVLTGIAIFQVIALKNWFKSQLLA